jgi:hypothetical protein
MVNQLAIGLHHVSPQLLLKTLFKMLPDRLIILRTAAQVKRSNLLNHPLDRAVRHCVVEDGAFEVLYVFPAKHFGCRFPISGIDNKLAVFRANVPRSLKRWVSVPKIQHQLI